MSGDVLLRGVSVRSWPGRPVDCRVRGGVVAEIGPRLRAGDAELVVAGEGGALLPGLADHHLHLAAMAARESSLDVSGVSRDGLAEAVARAVPGEDGWVRAVGYDDVVHGELDRDVLDAWNRVLPVRVQHRSGALWVVNSAGLDRLGDTGVERGLLWRADAWLRERLGSRPPSLRAVGARLAALGVTHLADATPDDGAAAAVADAVRRGELPQHVMLMAADSGPADHPRLSVGPVKLVVADHTLPDLGDLTERIRRAHTAGRPVAVHCVTRVALALTLAALDEAGSLRGDRVEHCAVADAALAEELAVRGITVVTQPTLVARRGDTYWDRAEPEDRPDLWPYAGLLRAGVRVAASSDAPYGDPDPWACLRAATQRLTPSGRVLGPAERVPPATVLTGLLSPLSDPGGPPRRVAPGQPADLVLLDRPLSEALRTPDAGQVRATFIAGRVVHG
ncbi:amidohydrolase family protein [Streptomyces sp. S3(2020)]|uniref:amidohydrolase family protein n=1 Tax=Streptomyces sp. S3(2020) TaxID=2732044 RepID=UPI001488FB0B|nr:amidohydrolase family protein [Streptomyces sp. S3(2020)]NNN28833.1 amidohydrolase family protein [Streptomyces sp. S3(2020)]